MATITTKCSFEYLSLYIYKFERINLISFFSYSIRLNWIRSIRLQRRITTKKSIFSPLCLSIFHSLSLSRSLILLLHHHLSIFRSLSYFNRSFININHSLYIERVFLSIFFLFLLCSTRSRSRSLDHHRLHIHFVDDESNYELN